MNRKINTVIGTAASAIALVLAIKLDQYSMIPVALMLTLTNPVLILFNGRKH